MYKIDHVAGRLVEVRLASPLSLDEVHQFALEYKTKAGAIHGKYVGVVDITHATLFPAPVAEALIQLLSRAADHVERTAVLVGEGATFAMQVERIIRNAASPNRRAFRSVDPLRDWLREVLTVEERVRLARFLVSS
ncbi:MAG TPA: hypothetical protein VN811_13580 [Thermoanaerobaculia bacterium]|nr:hypothetical protein [Thermoanaerobaculia bacterium]HXT52070.1 hypothetical protein [Thermoanaerobaculia bacterium]